MFTVDPADPLDRIDFVYQVRRAHHKLWVDKKNSEETKQNQNTMKQTLADYIKLSKLKGTLSNPSNPVASRLEVILDNATGNKKKNTRRRRRRRKRTTKRQPWMIVVPLRHPI
jgi:hypothetical protein